MSREAKTHRRILGINGWLTYHKARLQKSVIPYEIQRGDCQHQITLRIPSSDAPTYKQVFVDGEYDFEVSTEPEVIVDAGANIGLASVLFANRYPKARIIAIEPEQGNFEMLKRNTEGYPNITAVQAALWHKNEEITLLDPGLGNWGFMTGDAPGKGSVAKHQVRAMTVDTIMEEFNVSRINILKVDIEGAEKEVFSDTSAWINRVDAMIVELHERMKPGANRSFYLGSGGFDKEWMLGENVYLSRGDYLRINT